MVQAHSGVREVVIVFISVEESEEIKGLCPFSLKF